jgi:hypothetical protein
MAIDLNDVETSSTEIEDLSADQDVNQFVTEFRNQIESIDDDFHLDENEFDCYLTQLNNLQLLGMEDNQPSDQTGRPTGSTDEGKRVRKERRAALVDNISLRYYSKDRILYLKGFKHHHCYLLIFSLYLL